MNKKLFKKANEAIRACKYASFGVIDESDFPSVSAVSLQMPKGILELYLTTTMDSNKAKRLQKNNKSCIHCFTDTSNITLVGEAEIFSDQETKSKLWKGWVSNGCDVYPEGETDPNYCFIKFTTKRASLWIDGEATEFTID